MLKDLFWKVSGIIIFMDWNEEIDKLEYRFKDPVSFDKKIDPRKLKFGSKISITDNAPADTEGAEGVKYRIVKQIISPETIRLSGDLIVRMIGVKTMAAKRENAIEFLKTKILNRPVRLEYEERKHEANGRLRAYVYMRNKTFINAHLLKQGLCAIDEGDDFIYKDKFRTLFQSG